MNFFIVDDTLTVRAMLTDIIEVEKLGTVVGEASDGIDIDYKLLNDKNVDILLIDLLMPERDGIETLREVMPHFKGKAVMISQISEKDMIAEAYLLGIDHYVTKPINKYEVVSVIKKVTEHYLQQQSLMNIQQSLQGLTPFSNQTQPVNENRLPPKGKENDNNKITATANDILIELGLIGEGGYRDLIDIVEFLYVFEKSEPTRFQFPSLKLLFEKVAIKQCKSDCDNECFAREAKASEQRVRRTVHQALNNLASLGLTDYGNPTFEYYSSKLFDFSQVRMKMLSLEGKEVSASQSRVNIKKFIETLYLEAKERLNN